MADLEKILSIKIDADNAIKTLTDLTTANEELKAQEKALRNEIKELSKDEDANAETIRAKQEQVNAIKEAEKVYGEQIRSTSSSIQNQLKMDKEQIGSLKSLRAELSNATKAYDSLSREEREGAKGKELQDHINAVTDELNEAEQATQRYRRNVGNYKSALQGVGGAFQQAGVQSNVLNKSMQLLAQNPLILVLTAIVAAVKAVINAFKSSEEATMGLREALAPLNPIIDAVKRAFEGLANILVKVVKGAVDGLMTALGWLMRQLQSIGNWFGADWHFADNFEAGRKAAEDAAVALAEAENKLIKDKRAWVTESAKLDQQIADLREKATNKEKYNAQQRLTFLDQAIALETKKAEKQKELAEENLRLLQLEAARSANDAEMNDKLAEAEAEVINAQTNLSKVMRQLNSQRNEAINQIKAETEATKTQAEATKTQAEEYAKLTETEMRKAQDALNKVIDDELEQRRAIEQTAYENSVADLRKKAQEEARLHGKNTELYAAYLQQLEALNKQHHNDMATIDREAIEKEIEENELMWQNRIMEAYVNGDDTLQVELEMLENKLNTLHQYEWESDAEFKERMLNAQADYVDKKRELADTEKEIEYSKYQAFANFAGQMSAIINATGAESRESVMLSKTLALAQVAIQQGIAIAEAVASAAAGDPYTAALRIGTAVEAVIVSFIQATQSINSAKFARGGAIRGAGTATSDSIPIMASNGEYVLNAKSYSMFAPLVEAMNAMGNGVGVPAQIFNTSSVVNNYARGEQLRSGGSVGGGQTIVVAVEEINRVDNRVKAIERLSRVG